MRSSYRKIGDFIKQSKLKNEDGRIDLLLGVNLDKKFMPSVANLNGVDLTKYKVIKKGQFGCKLMSVGRDKKVPISRLTSYGEAIISSAYFVFEVIDENELNPEYLMMWFSRSESDRFQWFQSGADIRGRITWEEFCSLPIKVPSIEKQRAIVKEYNTIVNRIKLNEQLNQKLEETAQALYKHWFVDFEFPNENGQPYKSSGGEMVYNEELDQEIPKGWELDTLESFCLDVSDGNYSGKYPKSSEFLDHGVPFIRGTDFDGYFINPSSFRFISELKHSQLLKGHTKQGDVLITTRGASIGNYAFITNNLIDVNINSQLVRLNGGENYHQFYLGLLISSREFKEELEGAITGSAQPQLSVTNLMGMKLLKPPVSIIQNFASDYSSIHDHYLKKYDETILLEKSQMIVLSRMAVEETSKTEQAI